MQQKAHIKIFYDLIQSIQNKTKQIQQKIYKDTNDTQ